VKRRIVLIVAGSDSGGGAGIQADLKAVHSQGAHAVTVLTAVTAQNTVGVLRADALPLDLIEAQLDAVLDDFTVDAAKTGMLANSEVVELVAAALRRRSVPHLVVDPVMVSKHGTPLLSNEAVETLAARLLPLAEVATPNLFEAGRLCGFPVRTVEEMERAGRAILDLGPRNVIVKGGHLDADGSAVDVLVTASGVRRLASRRIDTPHTHGTGCAFASVLAARLALGDPVEAAADLAKAFITEAIARSLAIGRGLGPVDPLFSIPGAEEDGS
jgi:hydroxymethylpyrimidine/phosphomethylpyrimidine kinase